MEVCAYHLCCSDVTVVQAAQHRHRVELPRGHDEPTERRIFPERKVRAGSVVVPGIFGQHAAEM
jgi:hypothetical protein